MIKKPYIIQITLLIQIVILCPNNLFAARYRNILVYTHHNYSTGGYSKVFENTFLLPINKQKLLVKYYRDLRNSWNNTLITAGPVIVWDKHHYSEITLGYGLDSDEKQAVIFSTDLTREMKYYLAGIGYRYGHYEDLFYNLLTINAKYYLLRNISFWGKYFFSIDNNSNLDNSFWIETEYMIRNLSFKIGYTAGDRLYNNDPDLFISGRFYSLLFGCKFIISNKCILSYMYEQLNRKPVYSDYINSLIFDLKF